MSKVEELLKEVEKLEQDIPIQAVSSIPTPGTVVEGAIFWSEGTMLVIALSVLVFGLVVFVLTSFLLYKDKSPELLLKSFGIPLIIISAVFLIVAGYTEKQIAPVTGLLGTIAGYLLGRNSSEDKTTGELELNKTATPTK